MKLKYISYLLLIIALILAPFPVSASQTFTDNCYDSTHQVATDMAAIENNFAALKSAFSGAGAPADLVAGMWWYDTTTHILKIRNEVNNAWISVWDVANSKPVLTNIVSADFDAAMKDAAVGTASLRTLGTGALQALPGNTSLPSHGIELFTASGTWTRPSGVTTCRVVAVGGGGGGGGDSGGVGANGGGGGRGGIIEKICTVTGDVTVTIGSGGTGGAKSVGGNGAAGGTGGDSSFGTLCVGTGGGGGGGGPSFGAGAAGSYSGSGTNVSAYLEPGYIGGDSPGVGGGNYWGTIYGYGGGGGGDGQNGFAGAGGYILVMW